MSRGSGDGSDVKLIITATAGTVGSSPQHSCSLDANWHRLKSEGLWQGPDSTKGYNMALYDKWILIHGRFKIKKQTSPRRFLNTSVFNLQSIFHQSFTPNWMRKVQNAWGPKTVESPLKNRRGYISLNIDFISFKTHMISVSHLLSGGTLIGFIGRLANIRRPGVHTRRMSGTWNEKDMIQQRSNLG